MQGVLACVDADRAHDFLHEAISRLLRNIFPPGRGRARGTLVSTEKPLTMTIPLDGAPLMEDRHSRFVGVESCGGTLLILPRLERPIAPELSLA
jgi:hypothetical protein